MDKPLIPLKLHLSQVEPDPDQVRTHFAPAELQRLKRTIELNGLIHPVSVRRSDRVTPVDGERRPVYILVHGERRYRSIKLLHEEQPEDPRWSTILAFEERGEEELESTRKLKQMLSNIGEPLLPVEEARCLVALEQAEGPMSGREAARRLGWNAEYARVIRGLAKAPECLQFFGLPQPYEVKVEQAGADGQTRMVRKNLVAPALARSHLAELLKLYERLRTLDQYRMAKPGEVHPKVAQLLRKMGSSAQRDQWTLDRLRKSVDAALAKHVGEDWSVPARSADAKKAQQKLKAFSKELEKGADFSPQARSEMTQMLRAALLALGDETVARSESRVVELEHEVQALRSRLRAEATRPPPAPATSRPSLAGTRPSAHLQRPNPGTNHT